MKSIPLAEVKQGDTVLLNHYNLIKPVLVTRVTKTLIFTNMGTGAKEDQQWNRDGSEYGNKRHNCFIRQFDQSILDERENRARVNKLAAELLDKINHSQLNHYTESQLLAIKQALESPAT